MKDDMINQAVILTLLKSELALRKEKNNSYSLRSFARDLKVSAGTLSSILNGKRPLTFKQAQSVLPFLNFDHDKRELFLSAVAKNDEIRLNPTERAFDKVKKKYLYHKIKLDQFSVIKDWYHLGILNLILLPRFQSDPKWIAKELRITIKEARAGLNRLLRLGLIEEDEQKLKRTFKAIETPTDISSKDIRQYHKQVIKNSLRSLEEDDISERDITSIMFTVDKSKLAEAKKRIQIFRREMSGFLSSDDPDDVYSLNIQLFPQSKGGNK